MKQDLVISELIRKEKERQSSGLELIASENYVSDAVLEAAGSGMDKVLKTTVFLKDMNDFAAMNKVYAEFFGEGGYPARSAVQVAKLPKDGLVEIEAIAVTE